MGAKLGINAKGYLLTTGTRSSWGSTTAGISAGAAPTGLTELAKLTDVTITLEKGEVDVTTRGNDGWEAVIAAVKKAGCDLNFVYDVTDTTQQALVSAWVTGADVALALLDGASSVADVQGLWADMQVLNVTKAEAKDGAQTLAVTVKPTLSTVPPQWVKVTAGGG